MILGLLSRHWLHVLGSFRAAFSCRCGYALTFLQPGMDYEVAVDWRWRRLGDQFWMPGSRKAGLESKQENSGMPRNSERERERESDRERRESERDKYCPWPLPNPQWGGTRRGLNSERRLQTT